jgi:hypothetical protein
MIHELLLVPMIFYQLARGLATFMMGTIHSLAFWAMGGRAAREQIE